MHLRTMPNFKPIYLALLLCFTSWITLWSETASALEENNTNKFYSASGSWVKASNTNCLIWNSFPKNSESVTWSGDVVNGKAYGRGILQWFTNGVPTTSYVGEMKGGLADGHGIAKGPNEEWEGDWVKGICQDYIYTNSTIKYLGGGWYKGQIRNGFKSGQGEESMKGGVRYIGQFKYDRFDGPGAMIWPNGDKITGDWKDSKLVGIGIYTLHSGGSIKVKQTDKGIEKFEE